jgi:hypothetical protein
MNFAKRVFFWSGIYGIVVLLPLYFMEDRLGRDFPPPFNRPEQFYGFLGVAVAWQFAFLVISRDVQRYRLFMLPVRWVHHSPRLWALSSSSMLLTTPALFSIKSIFFSAKAGSSALAFYTPCILRHNG